MSETRSASRKQGNSKESGSQVTRTSHARTAKIRRTRETIERVEVEHVAEAGELPVVTTAEQRVFKATEMERGKQMIDEPLPQGQVTSSSRKQPGRASKKSSQTETDIPIEGGSGPSVHDPEPAQDEDGPPFVSTQDYLEEAEELLNHPLEPTPVDTQPEDADPVAPATEQEEAEAGNLTEQAPEEAAAAGERLAEHIEPVPRTETPGDGERHGADSAAHANEGGLVGRVAQVGRQIVRSLLHPNEQGHTDAPAAAAGTEAGVDQGEQLGQELAGGVAAAVAEVAGTAAEAGEKGSAQAGRHKQGPEYRTLAEVAAEVAAEAEEAGKGPAADNVMLGLQTAASPISAEAVAATVQSEEPGRSREDVSDHAEVPVLAAEVGQVGESGYESDTGDQDKALAAAGAPIADIAPEDMQRTADGPAFVAPAATQIGDTERGAPQGEAGAEGVVSSDAEVIAAGAIRDLDEADLAAPASVQAAAGSEPDRFQDGSADEGPAPVVAELAITAADPAPDDNTGLGEDVGHDIAQDQALVRAADTVLAEVVLEEISAPADGAAALVQPVAEPPAAVEPAVTAAAMVRDIVEAEEALIVAISAAADEQPAAESVAAADAAQAIQAGQDVSPEQTPQTAPDAAVESATEADLAEAEAPIEARADADQYRDEAVEPVRASLHSSHPSSDTEEALIAAAAAAARDIEGGNADSGRVDAKRGQCIDDEALAATAQDLIEGHAADDAQHQAQEAGAEAEEAGGEPAQATAGATQDYYVDEPDQSASEAEEPPAQPSKGRGRPKKADTTPAQATYTTAEASAGGSGSVGAKRGRDSVKKLKPYTPAKMAAMKNTPQEVQPVEEVLAATEDEAGPVEEAAPAPATPPPNRGRAAAPKTPPSAKGKGKAAAEKPQEEPAAPEAEGYPAPKKGRGRPPKAENAPKPSKPSNPAKRSRAETAEPQAEGSKSRKSQKTEAAPAGSPEGTQAGQAAPKTPARGARKPTPTESPSRTASKPSVKPSAAKSPPKKSASKAPVKTPGARPKGAQKKPARKAASRRKERPESFKIYIHRVLKEIHPDISLSQRAISVLDSFTKDMHDRIASEAGDLCRRHNRATLSSREIDAAIRFLLPGELFNHAVAEGRKAVTRALLNSS